MSKRDGIIISGLVLMGAGLFFWLGIGAALAIPGAVVVLLGVMIPTGQRGRG